MRNRHKFAFIVFCAFTDMLAMISSTLLFLNFSNEHSSTLSNLFLNEMIPITILSWLFVVSYFQLYRIDMLFNLECFFLNSWRAFFSQRIIWQIYILIFHDSTLYYFGSKANLFQLGFLLLYFLLSRIIFTIGVEKIKGWIFKHYTVAIWGFNKTSIELAAHLESNSLFIDFVGIVNENSSIHYKNNVEFSEALSEAIQSASDTNINELYIVANPDYITDLNFFFELGDKHCMRLKFVPDFSSISKEHFNSSSLYNFHVINPRFEPLQNAYNRLLKRIFDVVVSTLVIVLILSWLYPLFAFLIKKESKGPVLFRQIRTGKKNKPFCCYKFRSMYQNIGDESAQAKKGDIRVTKFGKFLRKSSLDEMPQFFNVLVGDMSVVGPRPHMIKHTSDYNDNIRNFMVRHFVKPGITGLSQVLGLRGETKDVADMKKRVSTDIRYLQNWSLLTDVKICILTIIVMLKGDENAF